MKKDLSYILYLYQIVTICTFLFLTVSIAAAKEAPIQIEADRMTSEEKTKSVVFTGNVDAKQGDVRIRSDKMTVFYSEAKQGSQKKGRDAQQIEKIICEGNVEVTNLEWLGTSDVMHYFSKKQLVQLIGNAKAYQGQNMVKGQRIDYHLDTKQSEVLGGADMKIGEGTDTTKKPGRVNMTILEQ